MSGYLEIVLGPMFSGKTTKLMGKYHLYNTKLNKKCIILSHKLDCRYDKYKITSHDKLEYLECYKCTSIEEFVNNYQIDIDKADAILVDECQFFEDIEKINDLANKGKYIGLFGLDGDANQALFGQTYKLLPFCDKICKLNGHCRICGIEEGTIYSVCNNEFSPKSQIEVGGEDKYHSICRNCYNNK